VQLRVDARVLDPADGLDPVAVRLRHEGGDAKQVMAPTWAVRDGTRLQLRFNVMQGPDLMPLAPGRWVLGRDDARGRPRPIHLAISEAAPGEALPAARFDLAGERYSVSPRMAPAAQPRLGRLVIEVRRTALAEARARRPSNWRSALRQVAQRLIRRARKALFQVLYTVARRLVRRNGRRILFSSDSRSGLGGNLKVVHDRMVERGLDREYELRGLFKPSIANQRSFADRFRLPWLLARADVILVDDYQPIIYELRDSRVRIVQLWHASGAFKSVGYSRIGKPGGPSPYSRIHKNYTHAIVSSEHDVPFYAEAFGIPESRVVATGIPRMDRFFRASSRVAGREAAFRALPAARDRTTILFAPTFRGDARTAWYDVARLDLQGLHAVAVEKDAVVIFKMHPFLREPFEIPEALSDRLIDGSRADLDINDLLFIVDLLITDYSSLVFEYATLGRPMLFFAYDLEEYVAHRDFYLPYTDFVPGRIVRTSAQLIDAIRREDYGVDKVASFATRHFAHLDDGSTDRVIDLVLGR
jgi:CDP-ribitol ribitolphosphotransferase